MSYSNDLCEYKKILDGLCIYENIKNNPVVAALCRCMAVADSAGELQREANKLLNCLLNLAESYGFGGNIYKKILIQAVLEDENLFAIACERNEIEESHSLHTLASMELESFNQLLDLNLAPMLGGEKAALLQNYQPIKTNIDRKYPYDNCMPGQVIGYYKSMGCGVIAQHAVFKFMGDWLEPVNNMDRCDFESVIGYEQQKKALRENTEAFLKGYPAYNTLLAGSRGTGKSTCVKALANAYFGDGLRIIDVQKDQIRQLPELMKQLAQRGKHFILFVDDLSFEDFELDYKYLKTLLEGSSEAKPKNVLFYATSNRRHIIQEKWSDKNTSPGDEELHTSDMINEKLALSDRFGLTITFPKPSPKEYMAIVKGLAEYKNITVDEEELRKRALSFELNNKGLSGRTAKQFVDSLLWETNKA